MRILKFIVDGSNLTQDPSCDFDGLFPGSEENIKAEFIFSPEWTDALKVVAFWSVMGTEDPPQILDENNTCEIPIESLMRPVFKLQVLGRRGKIPLKTNTTSVYQKGGKR